MDLQPKDYKTFQGENQLGATNIKMVTSLKEIHVQWIKMVSSLMEFTYCELRRLSIDKHLLLDCKLLPHVAIRNN